MFTQVFIGLGLVIVGLLILKFHQQVYSFTGGIDFVERWSAASTPAFIRLFAALLVLIGLGTIFGLWSWITNPIGDALRSTFGNIKTK